MNPSFIQYHVNLTESKHNPPSSTLLGQNSYGQNCLGGLSTFINLYLMTKKNFFNVARTRYSTQEARVALDYRLERLLRFLRFLRA